MTRTVLEKKDRKNILLISDHIRLLSGVGRMSKHIVERSTHRFNWYCIGGNVGNPDNFEPEEVGTDFLEDSKVDDPEVVIYPDGKFGSYPVVRSMIEEHDIDGILIFNDAHNFYYLLNKSEELKEKYNVPIFYYHVWDNLPIPDFNKPVYDCCEWIGCISRLTYHSVFNLHKNNHDYVPHGIDKNKFYPITEDLSRVVERNGNKISEYQILENIRNEWIGTNNEFTVFWCSRNVQRKNAPDVMDVFSRFVRSFPKSKWDKFTLLMKTQPDYKKGANLVKVAEKYCDGLDVRIMPKPISDQELNWYYNLADVTLNIANREGFGLTTMESLMVGTPIMVNVTGGLQDQCGFRKPNGDRITSEDYEGSWGSNSDKSYTESGEWAVPIFPQVETISGTQNQAYCFDHYVSKDQVAEKLRYLYTQGRGYCKDIGMKGRGYAMDHFERDDMVNGIIRGIEHNLTE